MNVEIGDLVLASMQGDQQAFGKIVARYQGAVSAVAYSVTGDLPQSEDVAQEAFVIAWKELGSLRKRDSVAAWLCSIARNLAREWMRKRSKSSTVPLDQVAEPVQPAVDSPEEARLREERSEAVWRALAAIPETYREPLILFYRQDRSIRDIAEALDLSENCVKQRLYRGRQMLREEVARLVEDTLEESRPGKAFTAAVLAALPPRGTPMAPAPGAERMAPLPAAGTLATTAGTKIMAGAAAVLLVLGGLWGTREIIGRMKIQTSTPVITARNPVASPPA